MVTSTAREQLATTIRKELGAKKISRAKLAREIQMSQAAVGRMLDAKVDISASRLVAIAMVCGAKASEWIAAYEDAA